MVLIRRLKNLAKSIARRLPFVRAVVRRSKLARAVLARSGLISRQRLDVLAADALSPVPVRGIPRSVTFHGPGPSRHLVIFFGVSHITPAVQSLTADIVVVDDRGGKILPTRKASFQAETVAPPATLRQCAPEGLVWYSHALGVGLDGWSSLQVQFHRNKDGVDAGADPTCFCVLVGREEIGGRPQWIVDLAEGNPAGVQLVRG
jgi:hypothetical protein